MRCAMLGRGQLPRSTGLSPTEQGRARNTKNRVAASHRWGVDGRDECGGNPQIGGYWQGGALGTGHLIFCTWASCISSADPRHTLFDR